MANYYTQFAARLDNLKTREVAWLHKALDRLHEIDEDDLPAFFKEHPWYEEDTGSLPFAWSINTDTTTDALFLWISDGGDGYPENVAKLVQAFLAKFRPNECWHMTWADLCDKPREDAYTGGAFFVTAKGYQIFVPEAWLEKKKEAWARRQLKAGKRVKKALRRANKK